MEFAAAILIVGGVFGILEGELGGLFVAGASVPPPPILAVSVALYGASIVVGYLVRRGQAWALTLNLAAIYAFLYLTALPNPTALVGAIAHLFVVGALVARRPWFDAMRIWRVATLEERGRTTAAAPDDERPIDR